MIWVGIVVLAAAALVPVAWAWRRAEAPRAARELAMALHRAQLAELALPRHIADMVRDETVRSDSESYFDTYFMDGPGIGTFLARLTSHPEVGWRWYPELCDKALEGQEGAIRRKKMLLAQNS